MGNVPSALQADIDRKTVFDAASNTRDIVNIIFQYILSKSTLIDINKMADKTECDKYIITFSTLLDKIFTDSHIYPDIKSKGSIVFKKIDQSISRSDSGNEQRQMCITLAYFYTRIFQIFGALALTLVDDANVMSNIYSPYFDLNRHYGGSDSSTLGGNLNPIDLLFSASYTTTTRKPHGKLLKKGRIKDHVYENIYLRETTTAQQPYMYNSSVAISHSGKITIHLHVDNIDYFPSLTFQAQLMRSDRRINFTDSIQLTFEKLSILNKDISVPRYYVFYTDNTAVFKSNGKNAIDIILGVIESLIPMIKTTINDRKKRITNSDIDVLRYSSDGKRHSPGLGLELDSTLATLKSLKPIPHCVARAMQLLTFTNDEKYAKSGICSTRFIGPNKNKQYGLPVVNKEIGSSPGINALSNLFYDVIGSTSIEVSKDSNLSKYIEFIKKLMWLFNSNDKHKEGEIISGKRTISSIINNRDAAICKSMGISDSDMIIAVTKESVKPINKQIATLFRLQMEHSERAGAIIAKLFVVTKQEKSLQPRVNIHPSIFDKGIGEINRINEEARLLLMDYYSNCERSYLEGVDEVIKAKMVVQ